jgi:hypothetical protein
VKGEMIEAKEGGVMKITIQRERRRTTIRVEIGDVVLTVELPH